MRPTPVMSPSGLDQKPGKHMVARAASSKQTRARSQKRSYSDPLIDATQVASSSTWCPPSVSPQIEVVVDLGKYIFPQECTRGGIQDLAEIPDHNLMPPTSVSSDQSMLALVPINLVQLADQPEPNAVVSTARFDF